MWPARRTGCVRAPRIRSRSCSRQGDLQRARLRRIADADVGAALVLHLQRQGLGAVGGGAGLHGGEVAAVGLDFAEELVGVRLPRRQLQRVGLEAAAGLLHRDAVAVQVIALGDRPVDLDAVARHRACAEREGFVDRQQLVLVGRGQRRQRGREQGD